MSFCLKYRCSTGVPFIFLHDTVPCEDKEQFRIVDLVERDLSIWNIDNVNLVIALKIPYCVCVVSIFK